jgi:type IV secretory pathway VirB10-like protein
MPSEPSSSASQASPKENPEGLALRASPRRVVRLNRRVLIGVIGLLSASVLAVTFWTLSHKRAPAVGSEELRNVDHVTRAEGLDTLPKDYAQIPQVPKLGAPVGEFGRPLLQAERNAGLDPLPESPNFSPNHADDADRAARLAEQQEVQEAAKSHIFFSLRQQSGSGVRAGDNSGQGERPVGNSTETTPNGLEPKSDQQRKHSFLNSALDRRIYASGTLESPRSPYEVMAGTVISAALVTGIDSDLPGQMIATVTENVFDTLTGTHLLIPQGSRLLGRYDSQVSFGQSRVQTVWTRLLTPDGTSIALDQLPGTDGQGQSGLQDRVNWHWGRIFAGAAVSTLIGVAAELAAPDRAQEGEILIATRDSAQQSVNDVGQQITRKNLDIQPTITVRPGFAVKVIVNKDLILKPYQPAIQNEGPA